MTDFLQLFFSGLATGSIYALAGLGFTLLWQASGTINFAQGEFVMLPAFMMLAFISFGAPMLVSFVLTAILAVVVLGWFFKRGVVDPLLRYGMMPIVVATIGLSIAMRNGVRAGYSAEAHPFASIFPDKIFNIAGVTITMQDVGTFALAMIIVMATQAFLAKTVTGRAMQAVAQNTESASVLGINVPRMVFYTFAINAVLAVAAALLVTPTYLAKFDMGEGSGHQGLLRRHHRRLQQFARRAAGRVDRGRVREPRGGLHLAGLQGRRRADHLHGRHSLQAPGPAG